LNINFTGSNLLTEISSSASLNAKKTSVIIGTEKKIKSKEKQCMFAIPIVVVYLYVLLINCYIYYFQFYGFAPACQNSL
jgi:hypothetical protein